MSPLHHGLVERARVFILGGLKQMAALFRVGIKQLEVQAMCMLCVFFRARIQLCLHFFHMAWIFAIGIQALQLRGYVKKKTQTNKAPEQRNLPYRIVHRVIVLIFVFFLMRLPCLFLPHLAFSSWDVRGWLVGTGALEAVGVYSPPGKAPGLFAWAAGLWSIPCCPECSLHGEGRAAALIRADAACQPLSHQQLLPFSAELLPLHRSLGKAAKSI